MFAGCVVGIECLSVFRQLAELKKLVCLQLCVCVCEFTTTTTTTTTVFTAPWTVSGTTRVSRYQKGKTRKGKTNLDLLEQEIVSGISISLAYANLYLAPDR